MGATDISIELYDHQKQAIKRMHDGCILCGGTGTGKSLTSLAYYFTSVCGGKIGSDYEEMKNPLDLYIITTARKRDTLEWEGELSSFLLSPQKDLNLYSNTVVVDSWNNIQKYAAVNNAFFIFDEQRVVGSGVWAKTFVKIAKNNRWILLSATPGDTWMDYIPVFVANGFYKNRTEFIRRHVVFNRFTKYPKVDRYVDCGRLIKLRRMILVEMKFNRSTIQHKEKIVVDYDKDLYLSASKKRWNVFKNKPMKNISEFCHVMRRISNTSEYRIAKTKEILLTHPRCIVFYNFDYELDILRKLGKEIGKPVAELNGHNHDPVPDYQSWVYLVQYSSGSEAWNCIETDTMIFYSLNYSWRTMEQAAGRIDRLNTPYSDLYYYYIRTKSPIDVGIEKALSRKQNFNENNFLGDVKFETAN